MAIGLPIREAMTLPVGIVFDLIALQQAATKPRNEVD